MMKSFCRNPLLMIFNNNLFYLITAFTFLSFIAVGQNTANYSFLSNNTGSLLLSKDGASINMSTGTTQIYGPNVDFPYTAQILNFGFTFYFMGVGYDNFSVNPDGQFRFGTTLISGQQQSIAVSEPKLFPMNYEGKTSATGKVHFKVQGTSPNSLFIVEWRNILIPSAGTSNTTASTFQVRLYENSGTVEYVYGTMSNTFSSAITYITGFSSSNTAGTAGQVATITTTPTYNSTATTSVFNSYPANGAMTNLNSSVDGSRRVFRFSPPVASAPTNLVLNNISAISTTLNWIDNASSELGYKIYRSTDGINYSLVTTVGANVTSSVQGGLFPATTYYWKVAAYTEGSVSGFVAGNASTANCSVSGVKTIPGNYASLTAAAAALQSAGISGPVILELQPSYTSASETFPITLGYIPCSSPTNTITIRPAAGATNRVITSTNSASTVDINGGNYWIIDGRSGGIGNTSNLKISNTGGGGGSSAFRIISNGSNNVVKYTSFVGTGGNLLSAVIFFIGSPTLSCNNNVIDNCSIDGNADGSSSPTANVARNGIYSLANNSVINSNNTISNCKIFNWFVASASTTSSGILLSTGNSGWTITGNSFYQTSPRVCLSGTTPLIAINISDINGNNFNISNNFIGGSAPNCGGSAWTQSGADNQFVGVLLNAGFTNPSYIDGNTITNINTSTTYFEPFYGIKCTSGDVNIGVQGANIIGNSSGTGAISILSGNTSSSGATSRGIGIIPSGNYGSSNIKNNFIGSITLAGSSALAFHNFIGIHSLSMIADISNNYIGAGTTPNSIYASNTAVGSNNQQVVGILSNTPGVATINSNQIANLKNAFTTSAGSFSTMRGIAALGISNIRDNTIRDLYSASNETGTGVNSSIIGIQYFNDNAWTTSVYNNKVYSLSNSNTTAAVSVTGIFYDGQVSNGTVERNSVFALSAASSAATINGIYASGGLASYINNMVSLGIDTFGNQLTLPCKINGILDSLDGNNYYHNTVYIGGTGVGSAVNNTFAFRSTITNSVRDIRNNIFINARSNAASGGKHYALQVAGTAPNPSGLTLDYNIYQTTGTGGVFGKFNSVDVVNLASWRTAVGKDINSISALPCFSNATAGFGDLHLTNCFATLNPADGTGIAISNVTEDIDGQVRSDFTPTDIGADAGLYGSLPTLGNYPSATIKAGGNITVLPDSVPIGALYLFVSTSSSFTGVITADPVSGAVRIVNAKPTGTYTIKVIANGLTLKTFNLTVTNTICSQGTFSTYSSITYGSLGNPYYIAVGDFNNDGNQDMARANSIGQFESYMGDGQGNFYTGLASSAGNAPTSVAIGDLNSDGNEDILVSNSGDNTVSVRLGDGTGYFNFSPDITVGSSPYCVAIGDFNNDKIQDITTANAGSNTVSILLGNGSGGFSVPANLAVGTSPRYVVVGDFNSDGNQDIAAANYSSSNISIRLGNGLGGFSSLSNVTVGTQPVSIALGDFNSDGNQDLITTNFGSNTASVLMGTGGGTFTLVGTLVTGLQPMFVSVGDFNSDSKQDVVIANSGSGNVYTYLGNGSGGFGSGLATTMGTNPFCVVVCDLNHDGRQDLISSSHSTGTLDFKLGDFSKIEVDNMPNGSITDPSFYGNVNLGSYATNALIIRNSGTIPLTISAINITASNNFTFYGISTPVTLNPFSPGLILWTDFTPTIPGIQSANVHIISNDCINSDYHFTLKGRGCAPGDTNSIHISSNGNNVPPGNTTSASNNTNFGYVALGTSVSKTFTISNFGPNPVSLNNFNFTSNFPSELYYSGTIPDSILPFSSATFTVTFSPADLNNDTAFVQIVNGYCNNGNYNFIIVANGICIPTTITSCSGNQNITAGTNSCRDIVNYTFNSAYPTDTIYHVFTGATNSSGYGTGSGSFFNSGVTHVIIYANNFCGFDSCKFDITVNQNINDNNVCTTDACNTSTGIGTHTALNTNDGNLCTRDGCDSVTGIFHSVINPNDNNACTADVCNSLTGVSNTPVITNDNNVCTTDACNSISGISHVPINMDDNNACTIDACDSVTGITHIPVNGDDGIAFTVDGCNSLTGVFHNEVFNLKVFLEGFYTGNGKMDNFGSGGNLNIVGVTTDPYLADTVQLTLIDTVSLFPVATSKGLLFIDGTVSFNFNSIVASSYYLKINHRNSIETWSAGPVSLINTNFYDFTSSTSQSFGNNTVLTFDNTGWAIYSGDVTDTANKTGPQDHVVDIDDYNGIENAVFYTYLGYVVEDLTGDGIVESKDYVLIENNFFYGILSMRP
jgi:hypothetical protein